MKKNRTNIPQTRRFNAILLKCTEYMKKGNTDFCLTYLWLFVNLWLSFKPNCWFVWNLLFTIAYIGIGSSSLPNICKSMNSLLLLLKLLKFATEELLLLFFLLFFSHKYVLWNFFSWKLHTQTHLLITNCWKSKIKNVKLYTPNEIHHKSLWVVKITRNLVFFFLFSFRMLMEYWNGLSKYLLMIHTTLFRNYANELILIDICFAKSIFESVILHERSSKYIKNKNDYFEQGFLLKKRNKKIHKECIGKDVICFTTCFTRTTL